MNFTNLIFWTATIITGLAGTYNIEAIQESIWRAQARLVYESRTESWGSPKFFRGGQRSSKIGLRIIHKGKTFPGR